MTAPLLELWWPCYYLYVLVLRCSCRRCPGITWGSVCHGWYKRVVCCALSLSVDQRLLGLHQHARAAQHPIAIFGPCSRAATTPIFFWHLHTLQHFHFITPDILLITPATRTHMTQSTCTDGMHTVISFI